MSLTWDGPTLACYSCGGTDELQAFGEHEVCAECLAVRRQREARAAAHEGGLREDAEFILGVEW